MEWLAYASRPGGARRSVIVACLAFGFAGWADGSDETPAFDELRTGKVFIAEETRPGGKTWVKAIFYVAADPDVVYRTLVDVERYPEFVPDVREASVIESGESYHVARFAAGEGIFASVHTLKRVFNDSERRVSWTLVEGRPRDLRGHWYVQPLSEDAGSLVTYAAYVDVGLLIPDFLSRRFAKKTVPAMVENLRQRVISGGKWQSEEYLRREHKK